jgi:hypothetical protein
MQGIESQAGENAQSDYGIKSPINLEERCVGGGIGQRRR